jgi:uncharacterized protein (TIGR02266 family)
LSEPNADEWYGKREFSMAEKRKRILIADDALFFQATLKELFERAGYDVLVASNGEEALQKIRDTLPRLDMAVLDLLMPKLSGFDVIRKVRELEEGKLLPVVAISSLYRKEQHLDLLRELNATGYLDKSMPPEEVLYFVNQVLFPADHEGRKHLRVVAYFAIQYRVQESLFKAYSYTLSEGGLYIRTTRPMPCGTELEVTFNLPDSSERIRAKAEVVHVHEQVDFHLYPPGMGVRFTEISREDAERIRAHIEDTMWGWRPESPADKE